MLTKGIKIEFESGMQYEIVKVYDGNICDIKALQPQFEWMPDFYPIYYSIKLESYKILSNEAKQSCQFYESDNTTGMSCKHCGDPKWVHDETKQ